MARQGQLISNKSVLDIKPVPILLQNYSINNLTCLWNQQLLLTVARSPEILTIILIKLWGKPLKPDKLTPE